MRKSRLCHQDMIEEMRRMRTAGMMTKAIAEWAGISVSAAWDYVWDLPRPSRVSENTRIVIELLIAGTKVWVIADATGLTKQRISNIKYHYRKEIEERRAEAGMKRSIYRTPRKMGSAYLEGRRRGSNRGNIPTGSGDVVEVGAPK